jgi:hypothetical protein
MSLFSSAIFQEDKEPSNKFDFFDEESNNFNPLDNSFSLMSEENKLKNPIDLFESQSQLVNSKNNSDIDKECSPAPAPLRSSQSQIQTDLGASHNMECPEVVQETEGAINNDLIEIFPFKDNEEDLVEKPFDQNVYYLYTQQNLENSSNIDSNNNSDLGDKSAAVNVINNNESMNSLLFKVTNLDINNSNNNNYPAPKHNFEQAQTPLCAKNYKFNISTQNKKGNTLLFLKNTETKKNRNSIYRKLKPDSLRKKIKARLHKKLTKIINEKLKTAGSKCFFDMLPQSFITNINIGFNKPLLNITMRELFQKTFGFKSKDKEKIDYNIRIMKYIEDNPDINNNSDVSDFLDSKYSEIIREYLDGDYLQEDIERLRDENEGEEYINRYNFIALHWIEFYENGHI